MSNFDLIDDYLANRLTGQDKEAFEKELKSDPALKSDVELQKQIVDGIRQARVAELKSMLSKVPVGNTIHFDFSIAKLAAGVITMGVIGAAVYYYLRPGEMPPLDKASADFSKKGEQVQPEKKIDSAATGQVNEPETVSPAATSPEEETPESKPEKSRPKKKEAIVKAEKPRLDVTDPSEELSKDEEASEEQPVLSRKPEVAPAHVEVEMDSSNKKYNFHYHFKGNKLMLYGSFDKSLYEVLEISGDSHAVFLYYKDSYYLLDERQTKITELSPIKDPALLKKLRDYRNQ